MTSSSIAASSCKAIGAAAYARTVRDRPRARAGAGRHRHRRVAADHRRVLVRRRRDEQRPQRLRAVEERQGRRGRAASCATSPRTAASSSTRASRSSRRSWPAEKPSFFYGDSTQWVKAVAQDAIAVEHGHDLVDLARDRRRRPEDDAAALRAGPDLSAPARDPDGVHRATRRAARASRRSPTSTPTPSSAATAFPGGKARAEKLGLPIVAEIVTKQSGIDVAPEVAKLRRAKPDIVIFQGYIARADAGVRAPDARGRPQRRRSWARPGASTSRPTTRSARSACALTGVSMYRYGHETDAPMINNMRELPREGAARGQEHLAVLHLEPGCPGMIFAEIAERCLKANKPLTLPNMKAALESMKEWDTGGITGLLADRQPAPDPGRPDLRVRPGQEDDGAGERLDQGLTPRHGIGEGSRRWAARRR